jgi:hypothetical protein
VSKNSVCEYRKVIKTISFMVALATLIGALLILKFDLPSAGSVTALAVRQQNWPATMQFVPVSDWR